MEKIEVINQIKVAGQKGIKFNKIKTKESKESLIRTLDNLQRDGIIYKLENENYILFPSDLFIGEIICDHKGNRFVSLNGQKYYINHDDLNCALDFDTVVFKPDFSLKRAVVKKVLERKNNRIICEVVMHGHKKMLQPYNAPGSIDISIDNNYLNNYSDGDRVVVEIENDSFLNVVKGKIIKKLGHKNDPDIDEISIANSRDFSTIFNEEYLEELKYIPNEVSEADLKSRIDLRDEEIFTIDCVNTMDIDDAISLKKLDNGNYLLGVHIANLSHYIKPDSKIFKEAYDRGTSLYLGNSVIPMFHHLISNGICSLNPGVDRLAKSCFMEINNAGQVENYNICDTVIHSKKKMNYDDINKIIDEGIVPEGYEQFVDTIKEMHKLSLILIQKRENLGGVDFASNEINIVSNSENDIVGFEKRQQKAAEKIIENFMIAANETVAEHIHWLNLPFVYRVHDIPEEFKIENAINLIKTLGHRLNFIKDIDKPFLLQSILKELSTKEEFYAFSTLFLKSMQKAEYSTNNIGHYALASDYYTHFTSPIRRLPDLLVHTLLDLYNSDFSKLDFNYIDDSLKEACMHASYKERQANIAEDELNNLRMAQYMQNHIGEKFCGRIIEIYPDEIIILTDNNIFGSVPISFIEKNNLQYVPSNKSIRNSNNIYLLGNKVEVTVSAVSIDIRKVFFDLGENLSLNDSQKAKVLKKTCKKSD